MRIKKYLVSAQNIQKVKLKNIIISDSFIDMKSWRQKRNLYKDRETINYKLSE